MIGQNQELRTKILKCVSRAMEDTRGLDGKYPSKEDSVDLTETLNGILDLTTDNIMELITSYEK